MPLSTPLQRIDQDLLTCTQAVEACLANAALHANRQTSILLRLDNDTLTTWLQQKAPELQVLLTRHAELGAAINATLATARATLQEASIPAGNETVDVRPLHVKLEQQGRLIDHQTLTVTTAPVQEPPPDPQLPDPNIPPPPPAGGPGPTPEPPPEEP